MIYQYNTYSSLIGLVLFVSDEALKDRSDVLRVTFLTSFTGLLSCENVAILARRLEIIFLFGLVVVCWNFGLRFGLLAGDSSVPCNALLQIKKIIRKK